jgi:acyl-[acyl-carrier-protein]-phospholipid O-acyltransferase/long-chain-fatty-acid--[acyl-carrier-protein] ligase
MVSLVKIESVLEKLLPEEIEYCAVEIPDSRKGSFIAIAISEKVDEKDLMKKMSKKLPPISLPRKFVVLPEMPKMGSGKVDFRTVTEAVKDNLS